LSLATDVVRAARLSIGFVALAPIVIDQPKRIGDPRIAFEDPEPVGLRDEGDQFVDPRPDLPVRRLRIGIRRFADDVVDLVDAFSRLDLLVEIAGRPRD